MDMTEGKPLRLMIRFSLPLLLVNVLQMLFSVIDGAILGRLLGVNAFASVGATLSLYWMAFSAIFGMMCGFGVLFAQRFGAKDPVLLRASLATGSVLSAALSVIVILTGVFGCRPVLELIGTPPELIDGAVLYLRVFFFGAPIIFANNLFGTMLRSMGDSKTPMRSIILATVLNIGLDFALIIPFGIGGVSAATLLAQLAGGAYCFLALRKTGYLKGEGFGWDIPTAKELMRLGLPLSFRNAVIELGGVIVQRYTNSFGETFIAGIAAAKRMYNLLLIIANGVEAAVATFVAQNFGAGKLDRVKKGVNGGLQLMFISTVVAMAITLPFGRQILGLMVSGDAAQVAAVLDAGARQLMLMTLGLPLLNLLFLYRASLEGIGNSFIPMISGFLELATRIVVVIVLVPVWDKWGVYLTDPLGWVPATLLLTVSYVIVFRRKLSKTLAGTDAP